MATIQFKKGDEYIFKVAKLEAALKRDILGRAVYDGAAVVTDEIRKSLEQVPTDEGYGTESAPTRKKKKKQKEELLEALGTASMQDDGTGFLNVKIGFDGYNDIVTKRWPKGQPNQMVARSVESGTTWMQKNEFVKRAVKASRKRAIEAMKKAVDKGIEKIMK